MDNLARMALAWDQAARDYDSGPGSGEVHALLARRSMEVLEGYFSAPMNILDIGCGTGTAAISLARAGMRVKAVDISPKMVGRARDKAKPGITGPGSVEFEVMAAEGIGIMEPATFDGAYSFMGPMNCVADLDGFAGNLARLLKPGSWFIASVINRWSPWEIAVGLARLDAGLAFRRLGKNPRLTRLTSEGLEIPVSYYTPGDFFRHFSGRFDLGTATSLGALIPPTYMDRLFRMFPGIFKAGFRVERTVGSLFPLRFMGDHFLITMRKRSNI